MIIAHTHTCLSVHISIHVTGAFCLSDPLPLSPPPITKHPPPHTHTQHTLLSISGEGWKALGEAQAKAGQAFVVLTGKEVGCGGRSLYQWKLFVCT